MEKYHHIQQGAVADIKYNSCKLALLAYYAECCVKYLEYDCTPAQMLQKWLESNEQHCVEWLNKKDL